MSSNGKEFTLKATDGKRIPVILREPIGEYIEGLVEVRGHFDGRKLNASNYMQFLREAAEDFGKIFSFHTHPNACLLLFFIRRL